MSEALFRSAHQALSFAFTYSATQHGTAAAAERQIALAARERYERTAGSGRGLKGLDGAAQAGLIRSLVERNSTPAFQAVVIEWLNDQPRDRWHTLAEAEPHLPVNLEQLMRLWNQWVSEGWLDRKTDSGRSMWRPTASLPIVTRRTREERLSWSDYFSSILELPVR
jgi:hypothetical protein